GDMFKRYAAQNRRIPAGFVPLPALRPLRRTAESRRHSVQVTLPGREPLLPPASCLLPPVSSVGTQIPVDLPLRHVTDVTVPFGAFGGDEVVEDVVAERLPHQVALFEFVDRVAQIAGQLVDTE